MIVSFEEMPVWQKSMDLAVAIHSLTSELPRSEDYGLTSQIRRAALSISDNIAEGFGRGHANDKCMFYIIARGSSHEVKSQLIYGKRVKYFTEEITDLYLSNCNEIIFELNKLIRAVRKRD
ncbi:MAG: four helix bundle protein [Fibrobacter sp.]|nr:four helix bundle protein [Fibrobacter sp.]